MGSSRVKSLFKKEGYDIGKEIDASNKTSASFLIGFLEYIENIDKETRDRLFFSIGDKEFERSVKAFIGGSDAFRKSIRNSLNFKDSLASGVTVDALQENLNSKDFREIVSDNIERLYREGLGDPNYFNPFGGRYISPDVDYIRRSYKEITGSDLSEREAFGLLSKVSKNANFPERSNFYRKELLKLAQERGYNVNVTEIPKRPALPGKYLSQGPLPSDRARELPQLTEEELKSLREFVDIDFLLSTTFPRYNS